MGLWGVQMAVSGTLVIVIGAVTFLYFLPYAVTHRRLMRNMGKEEDVGLWCVQMAVSGTSWRMKMKTILEDEDKDLEEYGKEEDVGLLCVQMAVSGQSWTPLGWLGPKLGGPPCRNLVKVQLASFSHRKPTHSSSHPRHWGCTIFLPHIRFFVLIMMINLARSPWGEECQRLHMSSSSSSSSLWSSSSSSSS